MEPEKIAPLARRGEAEAEVSGVQRVGQRPQHSPKGCSLSEKPGGQAMGELETKLITI